MNSIQKLSTSLLLALTALVVSVGAFAEEAAGQIEEVTVMGAVKGSDVESLIGIDAESDENLAELPVIEE